MKFKTDIKFQISKNKSILIRMLVVFVAGLEPASDC
nr:MAG TPA: hypothetical protein [Caudoviricetes sp.]